jgi:type II secretory pathway pseudopilin PulG
MKRKQQKRPLTLLEIMIVILLIGLIGSVVGVNMKGSLEEGKAFKSRQSKEQIADVLMLEIARGATMEEVIKNPEDFLKNSGLVKITKGMLNDGWGVPFEIKEHGGQPGTILVSSEKLKAYDRKKSEKTGKKYVDEEDTTQPQ